MVGKVYLIISPTGRRYIGSTYTCIKKRWLKYKGLDCKKQWKIYRSLKKHGVENHLFEVIWEGDINEMFKMERMLGEKYDVLNKEKGLNLKLPGYNDVPLIYSEETILKMKISHKGLKHSEKSLQKMREINLGPNNPMYGKILSKEHKIKMSISLTGRNVSNDTRKKMSEWQKGEKHRLFGVFGKDNLKSKPIKQFDLNGNYLRDWSCAHEVQLLHNFNKKNINRCCNGSRKSAYGFIWRYTN